MDPMVGYFMWPEGEKKKRKKKGPHFHKIWHNYYGNNHGNSGSSLNTIDFLFLKRIT
jgi:hypothetical protein